jgi:AsmA protein
MKWMAIAVGTLLVLAVLATLAAPYLVNLERYRSHLAARASRALGREVSLGSLRVSLWPGLGAEAQGILVAAAPGFGPEPLLAADALRVRLQLGPLLRGQLKVSTAVLERPHIRLTHTADGGWSIDDLVRPAPHAPAARPAPEAPRTAKPPLLGGVLLSEVAVRDGQVTVFEHAARPPRVLTLTAVDVRLRQPALSDPIQVRASGRVGDEGGRVEASGRILPESERVRLDLKVSLENLPSMPVQALLLGPASGIQLGGRLSGEAQLSGPVSAAAAVGRLDLGRLEIRVGAFHKAAGEEGQLAFALQREPPGLQASQLELKLGTLEARGSLRIPDLRTPRVIFDATAARLDLDRLLAREPARSTWLRPRVAEAATSPPPVRWRPPAPAAEGRVRIGDLRYAGLSWTDVDGQMRYEHGVVHVPAAQAGFMRGRLAVSGEVDVRPKQPRVSISSRLTDVTTAPLLKGLAVGPWTLQSVLTGRTDLSFTGFSGPAILGSAAGSGSVRLQDGRLVNYRPLERLSAVIGPILEAQGVRTQLDEFQQLTGSFTVANGILRTRDLVLTKAEGTVSAAGTLGLLDSTLDLDVLVRLGRTTVEAKVTGTTDQPTVVPKLGRLQQRLERELDKALPGEQGKGLRDLFRGLFGR